MEPKHILAEYQRSYYHERKRLGLCVQCGRKSESGTSQCGVCLSKNRDRKKILHPLFCDECERPIKFAERSGRRLHKLCAQKRQARRYQRAGVITTDYGLARDKAPATGFGLATDHTAPLSLRVVSCQGATQDSINASFN